MEQCTGEKPRPCTKRPVKSTVAFFLKVRSDGARRRVGLSNGAQRVPTKCHRVSRRTCFLFVFADCGSWCTRELRFLAPTRRLEHRWTSFFLLKTFDTILSYQKKVLSSSKTVYSAGRAHKKRSFQDSRQTTKLPMRDAYKTRPQARNVRCGLPQFPVFRPNCPSVLGFADMQCTFWGVDSIYLCCCNASFLSSTMLCFSRSRW